MCGSVRVGVCMGEWVGKVCVQVELVNRNVYNYVFLHRMVLKQHSKGACVFGQVCVQHWCVRVWVCVRAGGGW